MEKLKKIVLTVGTTALSLMIVFALAGCESEETKTAKENFNNEVARVQADYDTLNAEIATAEELVITEDVPLDETLKPALENTISDAKTVVFEAPKMPSSLEDINSATSELKAMNYDAEIKALKDAEKALTDSIEQMELVTNPSEAFVIERLQGVEGVGEISAVTEDNDPNGKLGKAGGYTATIYFTSPNVNQADVIGETVIEKGTDCGGAIEVYANANDATQRETYLAAFDGGILSSGSHKVIGTVLVRTSDKLTASQQNALEAAIIEALTKLQQDGIVPTAKVI